MHNFVRSMGFEPMISGMKTRRPRPLDEPRIENLYSTPTRIQTLITGSVDRRSVQLNYQGKECVITHTLLVFTQFLLRTEILKKNSVWFYPN